MAKYSGLASIICAIILPPAVSEASSLGGDAGWVRTSGYAAWVPLAPREIYCGYGDYGRNSVNITNSITVVHRTTFVTGRPEQVQRDVEKPTCRR